MYRYFVWAVVWVNGKNMSLVLDPIGRKTLKKQLDLIKQGNNVTM